MLKALTKRGWRTHIASLKERADAGEVCALTELGLTWLEGIQDRSGQSIVRRNPRAAVAVLLRAATSGDPSAAFSLGYAYGNGLGTKPNIKDAMRWYRRAVRGGQSAAASNIATIYRDAGSARQAFQWWNRACKMKDGDAAVDVGYGYQYGIGTKKTGVSAKRAYRLAIRSNNITQLEREAAMYHLAVVYTDEGKRALAVPLLEAANIDGDYPEAAALLEQIKTGRNPIPCRCKRLLNKTLLGHAGCLLHSREMRSTAIG